MTGEPFVSGDFGNKRRDGLFASAALGDACQTVAVCSRFASLLLNKINNDTPGFMHYVRLHCFLLPCRFCIHDRKRSLKLSPKSVSWRNQLRRAPYADRLCTEGAYHIYVIPVSRNLIASWNIAELTFEPWTKASLRVGCRTYSRCGALERPH